MKITRHILASKMAAYLHHEITLADLVKFAEEGQINGDYEEHYFKEINEILSRIGVADVQNFDLAWEDYERFLHLLDYNVKIQVAPAA
ncbi:MAG: hypothetical protein NTX03_15440 [Bacteroidetes bacterium]|nr:hypothetical protein [Bacteroidota bacterium]